MLIALSPEVRGRLGTESVVWLTTLRPDGSPHVTPVWFVFADDSWWIASGSRNVKVRNLRGDSRVALALPDGHAPVVAEGTARLHVVDFPRHVVDAFQQKYDQWDIEGLEAPGVRRTLIEVTVSRWLMQGTAR